MLTCHRGMGRLAPLPEVATVTSSANIKPADRGQLTQLIELVLIICSNNSCGRRERIVAAKDAAWKFGVIVREQTSVSWLSTSDDLRVTPEGGS